jgi:hypothetical protein
MKWLHGHLLGREIACITGLPPPETSQQRERRRFVVSQHIVGYAIGA